MASTSASSSTTAPRIVERRAEESAYNAIARASRARPTPIVQDDTMPGLYTLPRAPRPTSSSDDDEQLREDIHAWMRHIKVECRAQRTSFATRRYSRIQAAPPVPAPAPHPTRVHYRVEVESLEEEAAPSVD